MESPPTPPATRVLPSWAWMLSVLMFPASVFIAFGAARLLSWGRALLFAALSAATSIGFVQLMVYLESHGMNRWLLSLTNLSGLAMFWAWGLLIYRIGLRSGLWTPAAQKLWRALGWGVAGMICLSILLHLVLAGLTFLQPDG